MRGLNASEVLKNLETILADNKSVPIRSVCKELEIFDWWLESLSVTKQKQMRSFLKLAIELGYTGYVCFKVGASACANGMWAYKEESANGYSPEGECLYRSFTPDYTIYDACLADGSWLNDGKEWHSNIRTISRLKKELAERQGENS